MMTKNCPSETYWKQVEVKVDLESSKVMVEITHWVLVVKSVLYSTVNRSIWNWMMLMIDLNHLLFCFPMEIICLSFVVVDDDKSSTIFEHVLHTIFHISSKKKIKEAKWFQWIINHKFRHTFAGGDDVSLLELLVDGVGPELIDGNSGGTDAAAGGGGREI